MRAQEQGSGGCSEDLNIQRPHANHKKMGEQPCANAEVDPCPFEITEPTVLHKGEWLITRRVNWKQLKSGKTGTWEIAARPLRATKAEVQGVDIIATLSRGGKKYFVLVKQFRIPVNAWCLEFPAGLIDPNETVEESAIRELNEETGFVASRVLGRTRGSQPLDPGLTDDSVQFVMVEIDGDAPENANPKQKLDEAESIDVILVECDKLLSYLREHESKYQIEAMLYTFAIGHAMSQSAVFPTLNGVPKSC
ncbi:hypothetical protein L596_014918 [Steinernema carpocapsae]|uniref:Nudix hydrolase domain-containing protein n=1 Tax=Steinernema carpocapsae TaxID=34508 RepID=A0A4U5NE79_STECR|nr:hypothetical protein L596_014918 [Steinernema carpocapsae]